MLDRHTVFHLSEVLPFGLADSVLLYAHCGRMWMTDALIAVIQWFCVGVQRTLSHIGISKSSFIAAFYDTYSLTQSGKISGSIFHCHSLLDRRQKWRCHSGWYLIKFSYRFFLFLSSHCDFRDFSLSVSFRSRQPALNAHHCIRISK